MRELEPDKNDKKRFPDALTYLKACQEKPEKLKVRMARIRDEPANWELKEFGRYTLFGCIFFLSLKQTVGFLFTAVGQRTDFLFATPRSQGVLQVSQMLLSFIDRHFGLHEIGLFPNGQYFN